jgi:hypothetical protein
VSGNLKCCQVNGCSYLASLQIGHPSRQVYMCRMHAEWFRVAPIAQQVELLRDTRPEARSFRASHEHVCWQPQPVEEGATLVNPWTESA